MPIYLFEGPIQCIRIQRQIQYSQEEIRRLFRSQEKSDLYCRHKFYVSIENT
jgi:hypothetical protein